MTGNFRLGRIAGIEISFNWSVLVLCVFLVWTLSTGVFPSTNPHLSHGTDFAMAVAATIGLLCAIVLHEIGHVLQARHEGMQVSEITLWIGGGVSRFKSAYTSGGPEVRVAFAGPLVSLLLGGLAVLVARAPFSEPVRAVAAWLGYINVSLGVFNLFPALPLDGGRVLHGLLWRIKGDEAEASRIAVDVGRGFGYLFISAGITLFLFQGSFSGAWVAFTGWFLLTGAEAEARYEQTRRALSGLRVGDVMTRNPVTVAPDLSIGRFMDEVAAVRRYSTYPVVRDGAPAGLLPFDRALTVPRSQWDDRSVRDCMLEGDAVPVLSADEPAVDALAAVGGSDIQRGLVVSDGKLVGLVSATDLTRVVETRTGTTRPVPASSAPTR